MTITIRKAGPEDAYALSGLCAAHAEYEKAEFNIDGHSQRLGALLQNHRSRFTIFVAVSNAEIVGFASVTEDISTWAAKPFLHMDCMFIAASFRGIGLGKLLFSAIEEMAVLCAITQIQWQTPDWNSDAIGFYRRLGANSQMKQRFTYNL